MSCSTVGSCPSPSVLSVISLCPARRFVEFWRDNVNLRFFQTTGVDVTRCKHSLLWRGTAYPLCLTAEDI